MSEQHHRKFTKQTNVVPNFFFPTYGLPMIAVPISTNPDNRERMWNNDIPAGKKNIYIIIVQMFVTDIPIDFLQLQIVRVEVCTMDC